MTICLIGTFNYICKTLDHVSPGEKRCQYILAKAQQDKLLWLSVDGPIEEKRDCCYRRRRHLQLGHLNELQTKKHACLKGRMDTPSDPSLTLGAVMNNVCCHSSIKSI